MAQAPDFVPALERLGHVTPERRLDSIEADAIMKTAHQRNVFGMGPAQGHRRSGWPALLHAAIGQVSGVPKLLGDHPAFVGELLHRPNERHRIPPDRQFEMAALASQNRPGAANTRAVESRAVVFLAVAVMI